MDPIAVRTLSVPVENGQFHLGGDGDPDALERAFDEAVASGRFVGTAGGVVAVATPAEDSAGTPITVELWAAEMVDDTWDHEVDIDLDVPGDGLAVRTTAGDDDVVPEVPAGPYRARISGRGFAPLGEGDGDDEEYRIRLWPRSARQAPQVRRSWPGWADY
ncbi:hypothetical protein [Actinoplanes sp. NPDC023714]|uniref:hypothetical protein n=1 Tax=Actinoplanes sp. NPDC023714 TaxID=3154322 RepID=UPI0034053F80